MICTGNTMFTQRLKEALADFNFDTALALSRQIHCYEEDGHNISDEEDDLWLQLSAKIEEFNIDPAGDIKHFSCGFTIHRR